MNLWKFKIMIEEEMDEFEKQIPYLAGIAFKNAFQKAYNAGLDIVVARDDALYMINNQGKNEFIKHLPKKINTKKTFYRL